MRSFGWVSYDKVGVLYSGKLGNRSGARASELRSYPGRWWSRIKLRLNEGKESEYSPRTCPIGRPAGGTLCPHPITLHYDNSCEKNGKINIFSNDCCCNIAAVLLCVVPEGAPYCEKLGQNSRIRNILTKWNHIHGNISSRDQHLCLRVRTLNVRTRGLTSTHEVKAKSVCSVLSTHTTSVHPVQSVSNYTHKIVPVLVYHTYHMEKHIIPV